MVMEKKYMEKKNFDWFVQNLSINYTWEKVEVFFSSDISLNCEELYNLYYIWLCILILQNGYFRISKFYKYLILQIFYYLFMKYSKPIFPTFKLRWEKE